MASHPAWGADGARCGSAVEICRWRTVRSRGRGASPQRPPTGFPAEIPRRVHGWPMSLVAPCGEERLVGLATGVRGDVGMSTGWSAGVHRVAIMAGSPRLLQHGWTVPGEMGAAL